MISVSGWVSGCAVTYTLHGSAGRCIAALLHREATADHGSTVLSANSTISFRAFSVVTAVGGLLAAGTAAAVAMVFWAPVSVLGRPLRSSRPMRRARHQPSRAERRRPVRVVGLGPAPAEPPCPPGEEGSHPGREDDERADDEDGVRSEPVTERSR